MAEIEKRSSDGLSVDSLGDGQKTIVGYAAVFNSPTVIGSSRYSGFVEVVATGAFDDALRRGDDVRALIDHKESMILGRTKSGTLKLSTDEHGLRYEVTPGKQSYATDIRESIERGDVSQSSFAFVVEKEEWDWDQEPPVRSLLSVGLRDVSVVTYPAYNDTSVAVRSFEEGKNKRGEKDAALAALRAKALSLSVQVRAKSAK